MSTPAPRFLLPASLVAILISCKTAPPQLGPAPVSCTVGQSVMVRNALYFGQFGPDHSVIPDSSWQHFLATQVTPAFPEGFTVMAGSGQWREASGHIIQEPSRVVTILHLPSADADARIRAIVAAYKAEFRQEAVLWERGHVCASF